MRPGDLVKFDSPGQRAHGKVGLIVSRKLELDYRAWEKHEVRRFSYEVLIEGEMWRCGYEDLLAEEDWDETR
jgi:hypothetical protein